MVMSSTLDATRNTPHRAKQDISLIGEVGIHSPPKKVELTPTQVVKTSRLILRDPSAQLEGRKIQVKNLVNRVMWMLLGLQEIALSRTQIFLWI